MIINVYIRQLSTLSHWCFRRLQQIKDVQTVLEDHNAILKVLPHLSKNHDLLVREILSFMAAMLYGGNVQVSNPSAAVCCTYYTVYSIHTYMYMYMYVIVCVFAEK